MFITSGGDISFNDPTNLEALTSAVLISLFTNIEHFYAAPTLGTILYKALRMKMVDDDMRELEASATQSLQWLITDNHAIDYTVKITKNKFEGTADLSVNITLLDKTQHFITHQI